MLRKLSRDDEASQSFQDVLWIAQGQRNRLNCGHYEPRSLAAGYKPRSSARDARRNLQLVTEGFETADLKDARAVLEVLDGLSRTLS